MRIARFTPSLSKPSVFLERNPSLIDKFQREIAETTTGQHYYYEKWPNIDRLNGFMEMG